MLPLALGPGADPIFRSSIVIAVIGDLITSTLLSLLVVPAVFTYVDDAGWLPRLRPRPLWSPTGAGDGSMNGRA